MKRQYPDKPVRRGVRLRVPPNGQAWAYIHRGGVDVCAGGCLTRLSWAFIVQAWKIRQKALRSKR